MIFCRYVMPNPCFNVNASIREPRVEVGAWMSNYIARFDYVRREGFPRCFYGALPGGNFAKKYQCWKCGKLPE